MLGREGATNTARPLRAMSVRLRADRTVATLLSLLLHGCTTDTPSEVMPEASASDGGTTSASTGPAPVTTGATGAMSMTGDATSATEADGTGSSSTGAAGVCGDGVLGGDEDCDDGNTDPDDGCDAACAVEAGWACEGAGPSACAEVCGDGMLVGAEVCDGDVGEATCARQGYDRGMLACDAVSCTYDTSGCFVVENLQNDNGNCSANEVGCSNGSGTFGNPQDALECFTSALVPPLQVREVEYFLGAGTVPLPDALELIVHEWAGPGNLPGALVQSIPLAPADIVAGGNTIALIPAVDVAASTFCVGFHGEDPGDAFRVDFTDAAGTGESYLLAPASGCEHMVYTEVSDFFGDGNYCIRPMVTSNTL